MQFTIKKLIILTPKRGQISHKTTYHICTFFSPSINQNPLGTAPIFENRNHVTFPKLFVPVTGERYNKILSFISFHMAIFLMRFLKLKKPEKLLSLLLIS